MDGWIEGLQFRPGLLRREPPGDSDLGRIAPSPPPPPRPSPAAWCPGRACGAEGMAAPAPRSRLRPCGARSRAAAWSETRPACAPAAPPRARRLQTAMRDGVCADCPGPARSAWWGTGRRPAPGGNVPRPARGGGRGLAPGARSRGAHRPGRGWPGRFGHLQSRPPPAARAARDGGGGGPASAAGGAPPGPPAPRPRQSPAAQGPAPPPSLPRPGRAGAVECPRTASAPAGALFLSVSLTGSSARRSPLSLSTRRPASHFRVPRAVPAGGAEQARAPRFAARAPARRFDRRVPCALRLRAASRPSRTPRLRPRSTGAVPLPRPCAMAASPRRAPAPPATARIRTGARRRRPAAPGPAASAFSSRRSCAEKGHPVELPAPRVGPRRRSCPCAEDLRACAAPVVRPCPWGRGGLPVRQLARVAIRTSRIPTEADTGILPHKKPSIQCRWTTSGRRYPSFVGSTWGGSGER